MLSPYYQHAGVTIYHGDCREILPHLNRWFDVVVTDPVWPNALPSLAGASDPTALFREAAAVFATITRRLIVHLGQTSDPRFLLYGGDVAYVFGSAPRSRVGGRVLTGHTQCKYLARENEHPCPRQQAHVDWLVKHYADGAVLDPFVGTGTSLISSLRHGYPSVGIEFEERYCEIAAKRVEQLVASGEVRTAC